MLCRVLTQLNTEPTKDCFAAQLQEATSAIEIT
jgi:hypothetical protein